MLYAAQEGIRGIARGLFAGSRPLGAPRGLLVGEALQKPSTSHPLFRGLPTRVLRGPPSLRASKRACPLKPPVLGRPACPHLLQVAALTLKTAVGAAVTHEAQRAIPATGSNTSSGESNSGGRGRRATAGPLNVVRNAEEGDILRGLKVGELSLRRSDPI